MTMMHRTPDELRREVQRWGIYPVLSTTHPQYILDDKRLAFLWGQAREAQRKLNQQLDDLVEYMGVTR